MVVLYCLLADVIGWCWRLFSGFDYVWVCYDCGFVCCGWFGFWRWLWGLFTDCLLLCLRVCLWVIWFQRIMFACGLGVWWFCFGLVCCFRLNCLVLLVLNCIVASIGALNVGWYLCY